MTPDGFASEYRHKLTDEQRQLSETELARTLTPGVGISVLRCPPFWDVVARLGERGRLEFVVTDSSRPNQKPLMVHGPESRADAIAWAKGTAEMWRMTHVMHIDDEPRAFW